MGFRYGERVETYPANHTPSPFQGGKAVSEKNPANLYCAAFLVKSANPPFYARICPLLFRQTEHSESVRCQCPSPIRNWFTKR